MSYLIVAGQPHHDWALPIITIIGGLLAMAAFVWLSMWVGRRREDADDAVDERWSTAVHHDAQDLAQPGTAEKFLRQENTPDNPTWRF